MEVLIHSVGIKMRHPPFASGGPAITAPLDEHVAALSSGPAAAVNHLSAGRLKALGCWGDKQLAAMPELLTFKKFGFKDVEFYIWPGLVDPRRRAGSRVHERDGEARVQAPQFQDFWDRDAKRLALTVKRVGTGSNLARRPRPGP